MAIKFKPSSSSTLKNVKIIRFGSTGHRVGKIVCTNDGTHIYVPYILTYPVNGSITHGSIPANSILRYGETKSFTITPSTGYYLPASASDVVVTNALGAYNPATGAVTIQNPEVGISQITISATCPQIVYSIQVNMNSTGSYEGDQSIAFGGTASITITPSSGRVLPSQAAIVSGLSGATLQSYTKSGRVGTIVLGSPSSNIVLNITCPEVPQLRAPTISLSGDTLSIVDNDGNSEEFEIYVDGVKMTTIPKSG